MDDFSVRMAAPYSGSLAGGWRHFKNTGTETVPPYGVMRIDTFDTSRGSTLLKCKKPDSTFSRFYAVNGPRRCFADKFGQCVYLAEALAQYDSSATPDDFQGWGPKSGSWKLWKGYPGFNVIGEPFTVSLKVDNDTSSGSSSSGDPQSESTKLVRIFAEPIVQLIGKPDAQVDIDDDGDVSVYAGATQGSESDTGWNVTAWNRYRDPIDANEWCGLYWYGNGWEFGQARC